MSFQFILVLLGILLPIILLTILIAKSIGIWHLVRASHVRMSFLGFLYNYIEMIIRQIPADLIFKLLVNATKGGAIISINVLKDFFKLIDRTVTHSIYSFNKNLHDGELLLTRISSYYIMSGNVEDLLYLILDSIKAEKEIFVKINSKIVADIEKLKFINNLLKAYRLSLNKAHQDLINIESKDEEIIKKAEDKFNSLLYLYASDILSAFKEKRIFMSKAENLKLLKHEIFENAAKALIKAHQSGLKISLDELEVYFGMNGDVEKTVDILLKTRYLGFNISLDDLEKFNVAGGDIENTLINLINAKKAGLKIELEDLEKYHLLGGNIEQVVKSLIKAHQEGMQISIVDLSEYLSQGGDVEVLVNALIKLKQENIDIKINELSEYNASGGNVHQVVLDIIKAHQSGIKLSMLQLKSFRAQGGDVEKLINVLLKSHNNELDLNITDLEKLARIGADIENAFSAFKLAKRSNIGIEKEELLELQNAGGDILTYVKAISISKRLKIEIQKEQLEADVVEGRDVLKVIFAIIYARKEGIVLSYNKAIRFDKENHDVAEVVQWAINPQVINIQPITIISQDAVTLKLNVNVTVKGIIDQYLRGSRNEVLNDRINEAAVKEVSRLKSYQEVLESLNAIAERILNRLSGKIESDEFPEMDADEINEINKKEIKLNSGSAYEIIDVNIPNIEIGKDAYSEIRKEKAEIEKIVAKTESDRRRATAIAQELEAKAKLIESEAELQKGMAHAFKNGNMNTKEYYKRKIFEDKHHENDLGEHQ
ncbi:MAG: flotillin-like FloA family protein [Bacteroidales bacterium]|nr:flotillin-like FloA family protein [Bacteroidales bacterium]